MIFNESGRKNIEVFYDKVKEVNGYEEEQIGPAMLTYYTTTFENVYDITLPNPYAVQIARLMREKADHAVVATMPVFTPEAVEMRMKWVGLTPDMFDHITTAETSCYCKPNPMYFKSLLEKFSLKPEEVILFGNNTYEDGDCASSLGIKTYLVKGYIIYHPKAKGSYQEIEMKDVIPTIEKEIELRK
jgi:HAD superfamily hydrolase (TIGR01549 family)